MGLPNESTFLEESNAHLLGRLSDDFTPSSPDSFSDYFDDSSIENAFYSKPSSSKRRRRSLKHYFCSLTHSPLGIARRKSKNRKFRIFACFFNIIVILLLACVILSVADSIFRPSYSNPPAHYKELEARVHASEEPGRGNPRNEKIFIASNIIQHELIRGAWGASIVKLIDYLGPQNVFVSIYENDSGPETILALSWLRDQLNCDYNIVFGDHIPLTSFPTVVLPNGETRVKRLTYLSEVRNRLLKPLDEPPMIDPKNPLSNPATNYTSTRFDRVLFVNDIYFKPEDALNLVFSTNQNPETGISEYQAACSMDFIRGGTLYDSFVIRDLDGHEISWFSYPWFSTYGSGETRKDVLAQKDAVRVRSCWSGMAAYEATPFLRKEVVDANPFPPHLAIPAKLSENSGLATVQYIDLRQNFSPLRFRHQSDIFWEASECCLLNADLQARYPGIDTGMFVNPFVRVAYDHGTWMWQPFIQRFERGLTIIEWVIDKLHVAYDFNPRLNQIVGQPTTVWKWVYDIPALNGERVRNTAEDRALGLSFPLSKEQTTGGWKLVEEIAEPGGYCGQERIFVMLNDLQKANRGDTGKNWEKIRIPAHAPQIK